MNCRNQLFIIAFITLLISSCNTDDDQAKDTGGQITIGDFSFEIQDITYYTATLMWTLPEGAEEESVTYSIFLDGNPVVENLTALEYNLESLSKGTEYEVKLMANGPNNIVEKTSIFSTLENVELRLVSIQNSNIGGDYGRTQFYYDTEKRLIRKEVIGCSQNNNDPFTLNQYEYDAEGRLINETANAPYGIQSYNIEYFYTNDLLSRIEKNEVFSIGTSAEYTYLFSSETAYTFVIQYFDTSGNPTYSKTYEGTIVKDSQDRITRVNNSEVDGQDFRIYNFTYDNGNLVNISYQELGSIASVDISFDDKPNFHTYLSGTEFPGYAGSSCLRWDIMGMIWVEYFQFYEGFYDILPFFSNRNENNPISYNNGGFEFLYDYNDFDYPESIRFYPYNDDTEERLNLNYEIAE